MMSLMRSPFDVEPLSMMASSSDEGENYVKCK